MNIKENILFNNNDLKMPFLKRKLNEEKIYYTNDEGFKPYKVVVNIDNTIIYKETTLESNEYDRFVQEYIPHEIHIGNSHLNILCDNNVKGVTCVTCEGNSILLKVRKSKINNNEFVNKDFKYVFIGHNVYEFEIENDDIFEAFYSIVDDEISYPILLGKKNIYFLLDYVFIPRKHFPKNINIEDSYNYYYESANFNLYDYELPIRNKKFISHSPYD